MNSIRQLRCVIRSDRITHLFSKWEITVNYLLSSRWSYFIAAVFGALMVLGFAPFHWHILGILCPTVLFGLWYINSTPYQKKVETKAHPSKTRQSEKQRSHFLLGFCFGLGLFGFGASWIYVSISTFGNTNPMICIAVTGLFIALLSCCPALAGWLSYKLFKQTSMWTKLIIIYPTLWVAFEWFRSWAVFGGFPWLFTGYTQIHWPLGWYAPIGSVYLVSWLSAISSGCLVLIITSLRCVGAGLWPRPFAKNKSPQGLIKESFIRVCIPILVIVILWLGGFALSTVQWTHPVGKPIKTALVQGNISQEIKWQSGYFSHILNVYTNETEKHWQPIVVWPENALPIDPSRIPMYINSMKSAAKTHHSAVVFGAPLTNKHNAAIYYNSAIVLGDGSGTYRKRHLVPFGEYVPFANLVGPIFQFMHVPMSGFTPGPDKQKLVTVHGYPVAMFICYESAYPQEVRDYLGNAAWIITISDDSWFGHSIGIYQHEQMAQMRALETGREILRDTNSGITSVINSHGDVVARAKPFVQTTLISDAQPMTGKTPWSEIGLRPWLVLWLILLLICFFKKKINVIDKTSGDIESN